MSFVLWFTGLPCSGKTTLAKKLNSKIPNIEVLDGDELVKMLSFDLSWSKESRINHTKIYAQIVKLLLKHNVPVCIASISPFRESRIAARNIIDSTNFFEVYIECSVNVCENRDVKGMYKQAKSGKLENFCGVNETYDIPENPDLIINTENNTIEKNILEITQFLESKSLI
jgi:adenylylsulfate kinase